MSNSGAVTLGEIALPLLLEIACSRCGRHGRLSIARLIERYGAYAKLPALREVLAGDCPRVGQHRSTSAAGYATLRWPYRFFQRRLRSIQDTLGRGFAILLEVGGGYPVSVAFIFGSVIAAIAWLAVAWRIS